MAMGNIEVEIMLCVGGVSWVEETVGGGVFPRFRGGTPKLVGLMWLLVGTSHVGEVVWARNRHKLVRCVGAHRSGTPM